MMLGQTTESRSSLQLVAAVDPLWHRIRGEAEAVRRQEPELATAIDTSVLRHSSLEAAIGDRLAGDLAVPDLPAETIRRTFAEALAWDAAIAKALRADIVAVVERDPATERFLEPLLYFKGFHALAAHRLAHHLWQVGRRDFARHLQRRVSMVYQIDIHPAAAMGRGVFLDHATGLVIGETAVVEDDVSILQGVTLGGTGKETGDRHPKVRRGVLIGAGAIVLGNIEVGRCARIGAGAVVLRAVMPNTTVAGVPARVVGTAGCPQPSLLMDQLFQDHGR